MLVPTKRISPIFSQFLILFRRSDIGIPSSIARLPHSPSIATHWVAIYSFTIRSFAIYSLATHSFPSYRFPFPFVSNSLASHSTASCSGAYGEPLEHFRRFQSLFKVFWFKVLKCRNRNEWFELITHRKLTSELVAEMPTVRSQWPVADVGHFSLFAAFSLLQPQHLYTAMATPLWLHR